MAHGISYLSHHGIQGQKWGVRNGPPYPLDRNKTYKQKQTGFYLTDKQRRIIKIGAIVVGGTLAVYGGYKLSKYLGADVFISNGMKHINSMFSENNLNRSNYVDGTLKKGSTLQSLWKDKDGFDKTKHTYVSFTKSDNRRYLETLGKKSDYKYKAKLTTLSDIKIAQREDGAKVFSDMVKNDSKFREYVLKSSSITQTDRYLPGTKSLLFADSSKLTDSQVSKLYDIWNVNLTKNTPKAMMYKETYFKKLKDLGFGGIIDLNDSIYSDIQAEKPLLLFDLGSVLLNSIKEIKK